jgi:hypothetical protein
MTILYTYNPRLIGVDRAGIGGICFQFRKIKGDTMQANGKKYYNPFLPALVLVVGPHVHKRMVFNIMRLPKQFPDLNFQIDYSKQLHGPHAEK